MKAVYPGSFDPMTLGHLDVIERAARNFEHLIVLVSNSFEKSPFFSAEERVQMIENSVRHLKNVEVDTWDGLTAHYLKSKGLNLMVRGVRSSQDFRQEQTLSNINLEIDKDIDTVLFCCRPEFRDVSSRTIKEMAHYKGPFEKFVTPYVFEIMKNKLKNLK